jgi:uncharacterized protein YuzE
MTTVTDPVTGAAYATLSKAKVARTVEVNVSVMIDVDADDLIIGVETLDGSDWRDALATLAIQGRLAIPREAR